MALAIIGGQPARFAPFAELHRRAAAEAGHERPALSINSHGFIADDTRTALDLAYPAHKVVMDKIGRERGWPPMTRAQFEAGATLQGHNVLGSPDEVIEKLLFQHSIFDHDRFLLQLSVGTLPHAAVMHAIELYGTKVAPAVREEVARRRSRAASVMTAVPIADLLSNSLVDPQAHLDPQRVATTRWRADRSRRSSCSTPTTGCCSPTAITASPPRDYAAPRRSAPRSGAATRQDALEYAVEHAARQRHITLEQALERVRQRARGE